MTELKINLANMIIRIQGVHDTLRVYCKDYITAKEVSEENFEITVTSEDIRRERGTGKYEQNSDIAGQK